MAQTFEKCGMQAGLHEDVEFGMRCWDSTPPEGLA